MNAAQYGKDNVQRILAAYTQGLSLQTGFAANHHCDVWEPLL